MNEECILYTRIRRIVRPDSGDAPTAWNHPETLQMKWTHMMALHIRTKIALLGNYGGSNRPIAEMWHLFELRASTIETKKSEHDSTCGIP